MDPLEEEAVHPAIPQGTIGHGAQTSEKAQLVTDQLQTNDRHKLHMRGVRCDSRNWSHANQGKSHPSDSDRREKPEPLSGGIDAQAGHSRNATSVATAFEPLNRSLELSLTRLSRTNERSEKFRSVFKKPRCYKDDLMAALIPGWR